MRWVLEFDSHGLPGKTVTQLAGDGLDSFAKHPRPPDPGEQSRSALVRATLESLLAIRGQIQDDMDVLKEVTRALDDVLSLGGRASAFTRDTHLLGAVPELDSMAVVTLITTLEERLGLVFDDEDIDGTAFGTVGSLADFVSAKLAA